MTVYSDVSRVRYVANGITKEFAVPFPYLTNSDGSAQLSVYLGDSDTALVEGKDYYVEGIGSFNQEVGLNVENELDDTLKTYEERFDSGTVIFYNAPVTDQAIAILRNVPNTQGVVFINGENFPAADYANALDKLTMKVQELEEKSERSVILPPTSKEKPIEVRTNILKAADEAKKTAETAIELVGEAPETIRQETENAKNIITEFTDEKTATFNTLAENTQNELVSYAESKTQELTEFVEEKTEEFEQTAITATEQAVGSAERSRIWAEGEQEEVEILGGTLSSRGHADLAMAIANADEDVPIDASGLIALDVIKGPKGDKGDPGKDGGGLEIGDIAPTVFGIDETKNLRRYLNGQVISQTQFEAFTNIIKEKAKLYPNIVTIEENWQAEVTNSKLGQCGKFVIDDVLGTIRLPKLVNIQGLTDLALMGSIKAESLPNITGVVGADVFATGVSTSKNGALTRETDGTVAGVAGGNTGTLCSVRLNANDSSSTYQDNAPVQQEAIQYPYFIQVATGVEESVDVTREIELNNPFFLGMSQYFESEPNNASWLISNGSFHSGATYVSFYEWLLRIYNGTEIVDGVSVKASTDTYDDYDYVINTADTTFRLPIRTTSDCVVKSKEATAEDLSWYRIYKSGWIEQGGILTTSSANFQTFNLNKVFINSNYTITGNVCHETQSSYAITFRTKTETTFEAKCTQSNMVFNWQACGQGAEIPQSRIYFYVGETVQDANVVNASGVLTRVAELSNEYIVGLGVPDYTAGISLSGWQTTNTSFTVPCAGYIHVVMAAVGGAVEAFFIDDIPCCALINSFTQYVGFAVGGRFIEGGFHTFRCGKPSRTQSVIFYPCKGVI